MAEQLLERILYVEDDDDIRTVAEVALEAVGGFTLAACASGPEAVARAPAFAPQLVLLDVMMPGMDGPSTFRALRDLPACAAVPVVFMTAKVQPGEIEDYRRLGALDVIGKPFDPMTLADRLRGIWARRHG